MERKNIIPQADAEWEKNDAGQARYAAYAQHIRRMGIKKNGGEKEENGGKAL